MQQYVGHAAWDREQPDLEPLAKELLSASGTLAEHWPWLTSGDASNAWRLGEALAAVDTKGELTETLPLLPGGGHDLRLLCGYISVRRRIQGDEWYDGWVTTQFERDPKPIGLLFEVAWRCGTTESMMDMLTTILRNERVNSEIVGQLGFSRWGENIAANVLETVFRALANTGHLETVIKMLAHRMKTHSDEVEYWKSLSLELVTASELIRSGHMVNYYWKEVASTIVADYPGEIAAAIFREQADRESGTWFAEHSQAAGVLLACIRHDSSAVWKALQPYLSSLSNAYRFSIGFPRGIVERMPVDDIWVWIVEQPEERAAIIARLTSKNMSDDETLASRIIGSYGENERVASAFFSEYVSGSWTGPSSVHWNQLAGSLDEIAERTKLPKLRRWAINSAQSLRSMAERDRQREEEEELRWR